MGVNAVIAEGAVLLVEPINSIAGIAVAEADEGFEEHERAEDAVTFRDMAVDAEAAAFFGADEGFSGAEIRDDVFEADGFFVEGEMVFAGEAVYDDGARDSFDESAGEAAVFEEMCSDEDGDAGCDEIVSAGVEGGEAVGIAVGDASEISMEGAGGCDSVVEVVGDGLGGDAAERGVVF